MGKEKNLEYFKGLVNKSIKKYVVMTILGCVFITIGLVIMLIGTSGYNSQTQKFTDDAYGALVIIGLIILAGPGAALAGVGVPCWIAMGVQIKVARNKLGITDGRKDKKVEPKAVEHKVETATKTKVETPKAKAPAKKKTVATNKKPVKKVSKKK